MIRCADCKKDEREAHKMRMQEEDKVRQQYYAEMQEKMFQEAREEMDKDIKDQTFRQQGNAPFSGFESTPFGINQAAFVDKTAYYQALEVKINAQALKQTE